MPPSTCAQCGRELAPGQRVCAHGKGTMAIDGSSWAERTQPRGPDSAAETIDLDTHPAQSLTGLKLGDYLVGKVLGGGGMGEVYEGEQPLIGKKVAIKVLKAAIAADPANVTRMLSEARAVNAIRHRGIVDIITFGTVPDGRPYLVMEHLDGEPLDAVLRRRGALSPLETVELLEEICSALEAAHGRGIVHRDLKPGNVFVVTDGVTRVRYAKLLDFGLAKGQLATRGAKPATREGFVVGTPDYIAPEQARGLGVTPLSDLYSLGVMAFELVTGQLPFKAGSAVEMMSAHVSQSAPRASHVSGDVPPELDLLIDALLAKEPGKRPASAAVVRRTLGTLKRTLREGQTQLSSGQDDATRRSGESVAPRPSKPEEATPKTLPTGGDTQQQKRVSGNRWGVVATGVAIAAVVATLRLVLLQNPAPIRPIAVPTPIAVPPPVAPPLVAPPPPVVASPGEPKEAPVPPAADLKPVKKKSAVDAKRDELNARLKGFYAAALKASPKDAALIAPSRDGIQKRLDTARDPGRLAAVEKDIEAFRAAFVSGAKNAP